MGNFAARLAADRRRTVLETLNEAGMRAPEDSIKAILRHIYEDGIGRDEVRQCMLFLEQHLLVRIERLARPSGDLWVAELTEAGQAVARGRAHVGVAARDAA